MILSFSHLPILWQIENLRINLPTGTNVAFICICADYLAKFVELVEILLEICFADHSVDQV